MLFNMIQELGGGQQVLVLGNRAHELYDWLSGPDRRLTTKNWKFTVKTFWEAVLQPMVHQSFPPRGDCCDDGSGGSGVQLLLSGVPHGSGADSDEAEDMATDNFQQQGPLEGAVGLPDAGGLHVSWASDVVQGQDPVAPECLRGGGDFSAVHPADGGGQTLGAEPAGAAETAALQLQMTGYVAGEMAELMAESPVDGAGVQPPVAVPAAPLAVPVQPRLQPA